VEEDDNDNSDAAPVVSIHPVYVVAWGTAERTRAYFEQAPSFRADVISTH